jgi:hypothetical protein
MSVIYSKCILLFAQPMTFFHKPHRWVVQVLGQLPKQVLDHSWDAICKGNKTITNYKMRTAELSKS